MLGVRKIMIIMLLVACVASTTAVVLKILFVVGLGVGVAVALGIIVGNIAFFGTSTPNHKRAGHQNLVTTLRYIYIWRRAT